jgi:hypothetical protein
MLHGRPGAVNRMMGGFAGIATKAVRETADERITHHTRTYRNSIKAKLIRPETLQVEATAPYAAVLEKGSRPHKIVARRASALRFEVGGRVVYARSVNHPGTKGYNILRDGVRRAGTQLNRLARR